MEVIQALIRYFGPLAGDYVEYSEKLWAKEKYSGGCPVCNCSSSGVMKDYARSTREPFMNVHFCGTETATEWQGYMDGAVQSGERCANEVLYKLFKVSNSEIRIDYEKTYYHQKNMIDKK
jgi:monoamine oxidase